MGVFFYTHCGHFAIQSFNISTEEIILLLHDFFIYIHVQLWIYRD